MEIARVIASNHWVIYRRLPDQQFLYPLPSPVPLKSLNPKSLVRIKNGPSHTKMNVQTRGEMTDTITAPCTHFGVLKSDSKMRVCVGPALCSKNSMQSWISA
jgi:hypothetical protein